MKHTGTFTETGTLPTCECGGKLAIGVVSDPPPGHEPYAVVHSMPMCKRFEDLEPDAFISWLLEREAARRQN